MNKAILFLFACFLSLAGMAQETGKSKIYLKNGDVLTAYGRKLQILTNQLKPSASLFR
jgi:hypothetical protein